MLGRSGWRPLAAVVAACWGIPAGAAVISVRTAPEFHSALRAVKPGDRIELDDGVYEGQFELRVSGLADRPIEIRAVHPIKAWIKGTGDGLRIACDVRHVRVGGLRITAAQWMGIRAQRCSFITIEDCLIENCARSGILCDGSHITLQRCLIQRNGTDTFDHGVYFAGNRHTICDNVIRHNFGWGIHGYEGRGGVDVTQSLIVGNVVHGHTTKVGIGLWRAENTFVVHNQAWNNRVNISLHVSSDTNRVAGNVEADLGRWPLRIPVQ